MIHPDIPSQRKAACCAVSAALLLMQAPLSEAQEQAVARVQAQPNGTVDDDVRQVLVIGQRLSEQSSIERKKNARTAQDSIIADDLGSFPDRNVAEAISRVAGVALSRDEYGEGREINIRGAGADQTRVEIDGLASLNAGGTNLDGGSLGRGVALNELPAELISSVDIVKGSTADMTEGSLAGAVIIKTRTGLDFKKRTISLRTSASASSINNKWKPNLNLIFADKYLDGRLGMVANVSKSKYQQESHQVSLNAGNGSYRHLVDFDNSPEKTFSYQPHSLIDPDPLSAVDQPIRSYPLAAGGGNFTTLSPREVITRSAQAKTKADCYAAFPFYSQAQLNTIGGGSGNRGQAQSQRANELLTCLNQWGDHMPYTTRQRISTSDDDRTNADLRADYRIHNGFTVYAKYNRSTRRLSENARLLSLGDISVDPSGSYVDNPANTSTWPQTNSRTVTPGYMLVPSSVVNRGNSGATYLGLTNPVVNIVPGTLQMDDSHHLTDYTLTTGNAFTDAIYTKIANNASTTQVGGNYRGGDLRLEFLAARGKSDFSRYAYRSGVAFATGQTRVSVNEMGLPTYQLASGGEPDWFNPANYGVLPTPAAGQPARAASAIELDGNMRYNEMGEDRLKLDLTWATGRHLPILDNIKFGLDARKMKSASWTGAGREVAAATATSPAITVPGARTRSSLNICEDTPLSIGTANACQYGLVPGGNSRTFLSYVTKAEYDAIIQQALQPATTAFFHGVSDRPSGLISSFPVLDLDRLFALSKVPNMNPLDCLQNCVGSDGNVYEQPVSRSTEKVLAGYLSTDFSVDEIPFTSRSLPFGLEIDGNFGWRYVHTEVAGTTFTAFQAVLPTATYNPNDPNAANGTTTLTTRANSDIKGKTTYVMPVLNLSSWLLKDQLVLRFNRAKTIARMPIDHIYGSGVTCTYDFRSEAALPSGLDDGDTDMACSGRVGNPDIKPHTNVNKNLSLEWYPNRDTMLSAAIFRQRGIIGAARLLTVYNAKPFAGSGAVDPTGRSLDDVEFRYQTYINGPANSRKGLELSGKTAFTFLPSVLRYTGINANYTKVRSKNLEGVQIDQFTGEALPPAREPKYSWNASLWYDDGALTMRASLQVVAPTYGLIANRSEMRNPYAIGVSGTTTLPYDPGMSLWNTQRRFVDAKIGYKFRNGIEIFAEGRNLGRKATISHAPYSPYSDGGLNISGYTYGGARYMAGLVLRN